MRLGVGEKCVRPIHRGAQGFGCRRNRDARATGQQTEPVRAGLSTISGSDMTPHPCCCQVQSPAASRPAAGRISATAPALSSSTVEAGPGQPGTIGEQLNGIVGQRERRPPASPLRPSRPSGSRLVASTVSRGAAPRRTATNEGGRVEQMFAVCRAPAASGRSRRCLLQRIDGRPAGLVRQPLTRGAAVTGTNGRMG